MEVGGTCALIHLVPTIQLSLNQTPTYEKSLTAVLSYILGEVRELHFFPLLPPQIPLQTGKTAFIFYWASFEQKSQPKGH